MDIQEEETDQTLSETLDIPEPVEEEVTPEQQEEVSQEEPEVAPQQNELTGQALRFKTLREARERAEHERDALKSQLDRMQQSETSTHSASQPQDYTIAPDDLVEGKHLSKYDRDIKNLKDQLDNYRQQSIEAAVEARVQGQFPDFNSVVSKENIEMLKTAYPEVANTLNSSTDLYSKAVSAYTMIKQLGILTDPAVARQHSLAQRNAAKPRSTASVNAQPGGDGPLSRANAFAEGLTKENKAALYREMLEAKKNR